MSRMRIGLGQINPTVGDLDGNAERVLRFAEKAVGADCSMLITPEMVLTGYPPQDLLFKAHFIDHQQEVLRNVAKQLEIAAIVGCVHRDSMGRLFNAAAVIEHGRIEFVCKTHLPRYDVFDERRYFDPAHENSVVEIGDRFFGVTICEDIWEQNYDKEVVAGLVEAGAEFIVNISSSPFHAGKMDQRFSVARSHVQRYHVPLLYCNMAGGQDELVFDGGSFCMAGDGSILEAGARFSEDLLLIDTGKIVGDNPQPDPQYNPEDEVLGALTLGVHDYFEKCGFSRAVVGLSGGVDSALVACIAARALGHKQVTCVAMPSRHTSDMSNEDARLLADNLHVEFREMPIQQSVDLAQKRYRSVFGEYRNPVTHENLQARERGKILMEISNDFNALVLSTGNKTEYALGYTTLYGDMCGGLAVIGDVPKPLVYDLCRRINEVAVTEVVPRRILERPPSAELSDDQIDPFDYDRLSPLVSLIIEQHYSRQRLIEEGFNHDEIELALRLVRSSEYKGKHAPPILRISERAFGIGRRMPIVNHFDE